MEIFIRISAVLAAGVIFGLLTLRSAGKRPKLNHGRYELSMGLSSKLGLALCWIVFLGLFYIFYNAGDPRPGTTFVLFWSVLLFVLSRVTISALTTKISYDNEYLYIDKIGRSKYYEWSSLERVFTYELSTGGSLILKFTKRFWVGVPTDYVGFDQFERFARLRSPS